MKKQVKKLSAAEILRQRAEDILLRKLSKTGSFPTESDVLKLNQEISVHQIELEIQNKELSDAKENLENALEKYTDLYDFAPSGYMNLTSEGQITRLNLSASNMLGKERSRLIKNSLRAFVTDDTKKIYGNFLREIFTTQIRHTCEVTLINSSKLTIYVYLIGQLNKDGTHCDLSIIDISERKLAEGKLNIANKELRQSLQLNADKDLFISILAHDLRNPFSVLLGQIELLSENVNQRSVDEVNKHLGVLKQSALNTFHLLEDLLKWSRVRMGKFPFVPQTVSFTNICSDIVSSLSPIAEAKKITIKYSVSEEINVLADDDMLKAVFRNLVSNAIKFTNRNGIITISAVATTSNILFSVSDNGIGIESHSLKQLFDISKFQSTKGTSNEEGTGLGLLLCKDFIEKHGGKIWAESEYGKGSVFYFNIPVKSNVEGRIIVRDSKNEDHDYNLKILIADDDPGLRMILGAMVESYSKEILYAETGVEAVKICTDNPDIDLILIDLNMPKMNGFEAIKLIRMTNQKVIIIVETAKSHSDITEESLGYGINDFFFKPYNRTFLNELIVKHFKDKT